jgi:type IV pilus assembly protein PilY1
VIDSADGSDVITGYMSNSARSGQTEDLTDQANPQRGRWIVAVNNGHYNGEPNGEKAGLVVLDAVTGEVIRTIPLPNGYSAGTGLSGVTLLRSFGTNTRVVAAYAGDGNGQLWKFNLTGAPSNWGVEHNRPLFTVPGNRPIYGHPAWQAHQAGGFIVVFATGIMLEEAHLDDLDQQTIYGVWDRQNLDGTMLNGESFTPVTEAQLEERSFIQASETTLNGFRYYAIQGDPIEWDTQRGWFIRMNNIDQRDNSLRAGERSIADVQNFGRSVIITSTVLRRPPAGEMCTVADLPGNYVYIVNAQEASPELSRSFDVDGDGRLDAFDSNSDGRRDAGYAVAFAPQGGFTRGISVTRFRARADGTPLVDEPPPVIDDLNDPQVPLPPEDREPDAAPEPDGESNLNSDNSPPKCRTLRGVVLGTGETPLGAGVFCPTTGWNRTQIQLSAPPSN